MEKSQYTKEISGSDPRQIILQLSLKAKVEVKYLEGKLTRTCLQQGPGIMSNVGAGGWGEREEGRGRKTTNRNPGT